MSAQLPQWVFLWLHRVAIHRSKLSHFNGWRRLSPDLMWPPAFQAGWSSLPAEVPAGTVWWGCRSCSAEAEVPPFLMMQCCKWWCYKTLKRKFLHSEGSTTLPLSLHYGLESMNVRQESLKHFIYAWCIKSSLSCLLLQIFLQGWSSWRAPYATSYVASIA